MKSPHEENIPTPHDRARDNNPQDQGCGLRQPSACGRSANDYLRPARLPLTRLVAVHDHGHGHIVLAPGSVRLGHQSLTHGLGRRTSHQDFRNPAVWHASYQPVSAEQEDITADDGKAQRVHLNMRVRPQGLRHDVPVFMALCLVRRQRTRLDLLGNPGMVVGKLADFTPST